MTLTEGSHRPTSATHRKDKKMKTIRFNHYGEPRDVLTVTAQPVPQPGAGEVRVKIKFSPINPSDLLYVRGHYSGVAPHFPAGAGFEGVGIVDAVGPEVEGLAIGQRVVLRRKGQRSPDLGHPPGRGNRRDLGSSGQ